MTDSRDTSNIVSLNDFRGQQPEDPFEKDCADLAHDYLGTSVTVVIARYRETAAGVRYEGLEFEFDYEHEPLVLPSAELLGRTVALFAHLFAQLTADRVASESQVAEREWGSFRWDLVWNRLTNEHTVITPLFRPLRDAAPANPTSPPNAD